MLPMCQCRRNKRKVGDSDHGDEQSGAQPCGEEKICGKMAAIVKKHSLKAHIKCGGSEGSPSEGQGTLSTKSETSAE
eukprot:3552947-Amphidinium_carterae.1